MSLSSTTTEKVLLAILLLLAVVLRFYNYWEIPFTHDEFSALFRTGYDSFSALIEEGVVLTDFHPAGVQVFLYYYTKLFGQEEWVVKLPFILMGVASVYLIYRIGKEWFNAETALLTAAFMTVTQYFVFYSQIARPYIAGLFVGLLAVKYWYRIVFSHKRVRIRDFILWIFFAALSGYIHYYLLLTLVLLSLIGLFYIEKRYTPLYLLSGIGIVLLYLPHFPIFFRQLDKGGVEGWLGKPGLDFLPNYFFYLFEYLPLFIAGCIILIISGLFLRRKIPSVWWIGPALFISSFVVGFIYSIKVSAILQFSGLIFSVPLLLTSVFYFMSARKWLFYSSFLLVMGMGLYGLFEKREHYTLFYQSPFEYPVKDIKKVLNESQEDALILFGGRKDIIHYYLKRYGIEGKRVVFLEDIENVSTIDNLLRSANAKGSERPAFTQVLVCIFPENEQAIIPLVQHYFPALVNKNFYRQSSFYHFTTSPEGESYPYFKETTIDLNKPLLHSNNINIDSNFIVSDSTQKVRWHQFSMANEYGMGIEFQNVFGEFGKQNVILDVIAEVSAASVPEKAQLVTSIQLGDSLILWRSSGLRSYYDTKDRRFTAFHSLTLNYGNFTPDMRVSVHIWNMGLEDFKVYKLKAAFREGNSKLYTLYTPVLD